MRLVSPGDPGSRGSGRTPARIARFQPLRRPEHLNEVTETTPCYDPLRERPSHRGVVAVTGPELRPESEESCVERARSGDVGAFEELYRRHVGRVYALCLRMCGDAPDAEELTQDAFVRAWERLGSFHGKSAFSSWLHRVAVNVVLGRFRERGRRREKVVALDEAAGLEEFVRAREGGPAGSALDLERAIAGLPAGARTVFVLFDVEGYSHRDIAEATGLAVGTCKAQLHRARQLLRKALES
jgi:RNA polymerase sigma-70 factor (ECF subfamily)